MSREPIVDLTFNSKTCEQTYLDVDERTHETEGARARTYTRNIFEHIFRFFFDDDEQSVGQV